MFFVCLASLGYVRIEVLIQWYLTLQQSSFFESLVSLASALVCSLSLRYSVCFKRYKEWVFSSSRQFYCGNPFVRNWVRITYRQSWGSLGLIMNNPRLSSSLSRLTWCAHYGSSMAHLTTVLIYSNKKCHLFELTEPHRNLWSLGFFGTLVWDLLRLISL